MSIESTDSYVPPMTKNMDDFDFSNEVQKKRGKNIRYQYEEEFSNDIDAKKK